MTAVLYCEGEVLFVRRRPELKAFPGYTSFPGGAVEQGESNREALGREIQEELSLDLIDLRPLQVELLGEATTPKFNPRRFLNLFYFVELENKPELKLCPHEIEEAFWMTPEEFIESFKKGEQLLVPPTLQAIRVLAQGVENALEKGPHNLNIDYDELQQVPMIETVGGVKQLLPLSNTFPPANRTNCFLIGDDEASRVLVDVSPASLEELEKLKHTIGDERIDQLFITHHHPDHHEFAARLARELNVPISLGSDTLRRILKKWGGDYFKDVEVIELKAGDTLTKWNGEDVQLHALPGHDEGLMGLAPASFKWMIVSDLIQTIGTVVVGGEEGDMAKYFQSLQKVIDLEPLHIFPSHGMALRGTWKLRQTLKHRLEREQQVLACLEKGLGVQECFESIYPDLDDKLKPYALLTIEAHIKKIETHGVGMIDLP